MYVLPLVTRELNVALRRPWTHRLRKWVGGGTMAATVWAFLAWGGSKGNTGEVLFESFTLLAALACMVMGIFLVSDSLSRERREGTLGFLFLTDLNCAEVVLGKITAAGIVPASLLLAMFPGFAICQLAGGVTGSEFWRTIASLVLTLTFVLTSTVYISSHTSSHRKSYGWATALLLVLNPLWLCWLAFDANYRIKVNLLFVIVPVFWIFFIGFLFLTFALFLRTCSVLERDWRDKEVIQTKSEKIRSTLKSVKASLEEDPIAWLMLRRQNARWGRASLILAVAVTGCFAFLLPWNFDPKKKFLFLGLLFSIHLAYELLVLARTAYSFYLDRQDGSLELLLGTRLGTEEVFNGFYSFLVKHSKGVLIYLSALDLVTCVAIIASGDLTSSALPFAMAITLWCSVLGLGWLGVYRSLMTNHPLHAMVATFFRLLFFPLLITAIFLFSPRTQINETVTFWIISTAFVSLFFGSEARRSLFKHGRTLLMRPYAEKVPHIESELSFINWDDAIEKPPPIPQGNFQGA
jgi:hypothetical protein